MTLIHQLRYNSYMCVYFLVVWYPNSWSTDKLVGGKNFAKKCPSIEKGPYAGLKFSHRYYLWQLHFHWGEVGNDEKGSEHTVNGKS